MATFIGMPHAQKAIVSTVAAGNTVITRGLIKRGWVYRIVSDVDVYLDLESPASLTSGWYLPAKTIDYMVFGGSDSAGTDVELNHFGTGAGKISLTPIMRVQSF
jgi:hypothetical protein